MNFGDQIQMAIDWKILMQTDATDLVHGDSLLEDVIDLLLLGNIAADDPMSVPMCHYLHFMTLLQSALQYIWDLHRRQAAMLAATVEASDTACAYNTALQQYVKAVHGDLKQVGATDVGSTPAFVSEALRVQLRAVKRVSDAAVKGLQVEDEKQRKCSLAFMSHKLAIDWAKLCASPSPRLTEETSCGAVGILLPVLAYGDLEEQDWCSLTTAHCLAFIQLAQQALQLLLQELAAVHESLSAAQLRLHKQKAVGQRLHDHSRACFRQLRQASQAKALPNPVSSATEAVCSAGAQLCSSARPEPDRQATAVIPQSRPASPVKGSRVQYAASTGLPVQVQHMPTAAVVALPAQQGQAGAAADSVHDEHAAQQPAVTDQPVECEQSQQVERHDAAQSSSDEVQVSDLTDTLRSEQQALHSARSALADLWTLLTLPHPDTAAADALLSVEAANTLAMSEGEYRCSLPASEELSTTPHLTSIDLDLEALRAEERSHAEAQVRTVVDHIKQQALQDVTQRMQLKSQTSSMHKQASRRASGVQPRLEQPSFIPPLSSTQPMQQFASQSAVSEIVSHLRTSSNVSQTAHPSAQMQRMHSGRPPKLASKSIHRLSQPELLHTMSGVMPSSPSRLGAGLTPKRLMRLTSCVKLNRSDVI